MSQVVLNMLLAEIIRGVNLKSKLAFLKDIKQSRPRCESERQGRDWTDVLGQE